MKGLSFILAFAAAFGMVLFANPAVAGNCCVVQQVVAAPLVQSVIVPQAVILPQVVSVPVVQQRVVQRVVRQPVVQRQVVRQRVVVPQVQRSINIQRSRGLRSSSFQFNRVGGFGGASALQFNRFSSFGGFNTGFSTFGGFPDSSAFSFRSGFGSPFGSSLSIQRLRF